MKRVESASFGLDYPPSTANKHHQHGNDDPRHGHRTKKKDMAPSQRQSDEYDNLENITKGKRKGKSQTKVRIVFHEKIQVYSRIFCLETF